MRKKEEDAPPGAPGWMVTYGDMMSLLLTFFVLLLSFSSIQESKFKEAIGSLQMALGVLSGPRMVMPSTQPPLPRSRVSNQIKVQMKKVKSYLEMAGVGGSVEVNPTKEGYVIRFSSPLLFDTGSAELRDEAKGLLAEITSIVGAFRNTLRIEGHTDNVPIHNSRYPSNWELSTARALTVLKFMNAQGVDPARLSAAGYGEFRPIAPNDTPEHRMLNRRVELYVNTLVEERKGGWPFQEEKNGR